MFTIFLLITLSERFLQFYYKSKRKRDINKSYVLYKNLYKNINGLLLSKKDRTNKDSFELVYGEIPFFTLADILEIVRPKADAVFYDLGAGIGKAIIAAALLYPFKELKGIEVLPSLYQCCTQIKEKFYRYSYDAKCTNKNNVFFIHADFLDYDFTDADIIYLNATGFFGVKKELLIRKLLEIKSGCYVIINSKTLPESHFKLIHKKFWPMSWGLSLISIYRKV